MNSYESSPLAEVMPSHLGKLSTSIDILLKPFTWAPDVSKHKIHSVINAMSLTKLIVFFESLILSIMYIKLTKGHVSFYVSLSCFSLSTNFQNGYYSVFER